MQHYKIGVLKAEKIKGNLVIMKVLYHSEV